MKKLLTLGVGAAVITIASCNDGGERPTSPPVDPSLGVTASALSVQPDQPEDAEDGEAKRRAAKERFHKRNYADWVGKAHNDALEAFFTQLALGGGSRNVCSMIVDFMSDAARVPHGKNPGSDAQRRRIVSLGLQGTGCAPNVAQSESPTFGFASRLIANQSGSAELNARLDEIKYAGWIAPTSGDLAISLNAILDRADFLSPTEAELVYTAASVAQSSYEDWEANIVPRTDQIQTSYGSCLGGYSIGADGLKYCMGIGVVAYVRPTTDLESPEPLRVMFASSMQTGTVCYRGRRETIYSDIAGGIVGMFGGSLVPAVGTLLGGLGGAASSSGTTGLTYMGLYVHCRLTGGASDRQTTTRRTY